MAAADDSLAGLALILRRCDSQGTPPELLGGLLLSPDGDRANVLTAEEARQVEERLNEALARGEPLAGRRYPLHRRQCPGQEWEISVSAIPLEPAAAVLIDLDEGQPARRRLDLLYRAAANIGASLDITRTAQDLVDVIVPVFADYATVNLSDAVLAGDEPPRPIRKDFRRVAVSEPWPAGLVQAGDPIPLPPDLPAARTLERGEPVLMTSRSRILQELAGHTRVMVPADARSLLVAPLYARGLLLGGVEAWRTGRSDAFDDEDVRFLQEIVSRAALSVDNARRYTREHTAAVTLQRSLLPQAPVDLTAAQTAGIYQPAGDRAEVGGDWFDVIPLSSLRVAFVVGDITGHGLQATATMGRLRTAIQTLADLDLPPDELLTHLDDLVLRLAEESGGSGEGIGATCLYVTYDPVTRRCAMASAGHPPPALVQPGAAAAFVDLSPGPPLGVGNMPFEPAEILLPEGSVLALYTDGLVERDDHDLSDGMDRLCRRLDVLCRPGRALPEIGRHLVAELPAAPPVDDIALLLARTFAMPATDTVGWEFPADPAVVGDARKLTSGQLAAWRLDEMALVTELVVSELVTNAIRYGGAPVGLRLIRDRHVLICEVSDSSSTQPRLRRARETDEGGRGLFLVAQLTSRWGSRYTQAGKTIWTEQPIGDLAA
ncbi:SpoIIE family protein phosphatase [Nonomuraea sp. PA05]|uniref:ATP-binding SpoIIE family protein phosphatase n=1 Tax=Nonomuraea sp. PA05 TaxID=2604466 RepID=UPI0011DC4F43|nr:SpoIIE family protein phosphatase [Nonomuraea sp. PA05]TYB71022.1 SpoIIE family protein phosphatase [Nonomuraea sp. PA05]